MNDQLEPNAVRSALSALDARQRKIVIGLVAILIQNPRRVQEREWVSEELSRVALLSLGEEVESGPQAVEDLQAYLKANGPLLLRSALQLFQRAGLDLQAEAASGFTFERAMEVVVSYLEPVTD